MSPTHQPYATAYANKGRDARIRVGQSTEDDPFYIAPWYRYLAAAGTIAGAYHGYKRNNSIGWAIGWGLLGGAFPFFTIPVALAQGFGERKHG